MQNLFDYLLTGKDLTIIKGCFFHYEIEFMLAIIRASLKETVEETRLPSIDFEKRSENALANLTGWFDRKDYMKLNKGISSATASRDLKHLLETERLELSGEGRMTRYRKKD